MKVAFLKAEHFFFPGEYLRSFDDEVARNQRRQVAFAPIFRDSFFFLVGVVWMVGGHDKALV